MNWNIPIRLSSTRRSPPTNDDLGFGKIFADHLFQVRFTRGRGWHDPEIVPYGPLAIDPAASVLHYGQALFEGLKAFRRKDGSIAVFRPEFNGRRMAEGAKRLCMEAPPEDLWLEGLSKLIDVCADWVPTKRGNSLYIRPTLVATEPFLGVRPSNEYLFYIILSPVSAYYAEGLNPVKIWIEKDYIRAAPGGLGMTKAAANYSGSLKAALLAKDKGFAQVLWLDVEKAHIEEVGTMNVFFVIGDEVVTPSLDGTILEGGTRAVASQLLREWNLKVSERKIRLDEVVAASNNGTLKEAFGTGTAAVITPIGELTSTDFSIKLQAGADTLSSRLYKEITALHYGEKPDPYGWMRPLPLS